MESKPLDQLTPKEVEYLLTGMNFPNELINQLDGVDGTALGKILLEDFSQSIPLKYLQYAQLRNDLLSSDDSTVFVSIPPDHFLPGFSSDVENWHDALSVYGCNLRDLTSSELRTLLLHKRVPLLDLEKLKMYNGNTFHMALKTNKDLSISEHSRLQSLYGGNFTRNILNEHLVEPINMSTTELMDFLGGYLPSFEVDRLKVYDGKQLIWILNREGVSADTLAKDLGVSVDSASSLIKILMHHRLSTTDQNTVSDKTLKRLSKEQLAQLLRNNHIPKIHLEALAYLDGSLLDKLLQEKNDDRTFAGDLGVPLGVAISIARLFESIDRVIEDSELADLTSKGLYSTEAVEKEGEGKEGDDGNDKRKRKGQHLTSKDEEKQLFSTKLRPYLPPPINNIPATKESITRTSKSIDLKVIVADRTILRLGTNDSNKYPIKIGSKADELTKTQNIKYIESVKISKDTSDQQIDKPFLSCLSEKLGKNVRSFYIFLAISNKRDMNTSNNGISFTGYSHLNPPTFQIIEALKNGKNDVILTEKIFTSDFKGSIDPNGHNIIQDDEI